MVTKLRDPTASEKPFRVCRANRCTCRNTTRRPPAPGCRCIRWCIGVHRWYGHTKSRAAQQQIESAISVLPHAEPQVRRPQGGGGAQEDSTTVPVQ